MVEKKFQREFLNFQMWNYEFIRAYNHGFRELNFKVETKIVCEKKTDKWIYELMDLRYDWFFEGLNLPATYWMTSKSL